MAASRVACASFNIGTSTVIAITRDKSTYKHTIRYVYGYLSGTIATKTDQTSIAWTPDAEDFYSQIPNGVIGYGSVFCDTYDGNTLIGTTRADFNAYAVKENCLPTVSAVIEDTNPATIAVTGDKTKLVCYISKPKVTLNATAKNSATIKSRQIYNPVGLIATESPYTFDTVYSDQFMLKATDSRGYTTEEVQKVELVLYDPCFFYSVSLKRTESTATTARAELTGFCFNSSFGASNNALTLKYRYRTTGEYGNYITIPSPVWNNDGTFSASIDIPSLSLDETYIFEFVAEDKLTSFVADEIILGKGAGDLRIAKDYIQTKNSVYAGDIDNTLWKCFGTRRKVNGVAYQSNFGTGVVGSEAAAVLELYNEDAITGRVELRNDGHLYNLLSSMSFAEMMAVSPSNDWDNTQGYLILNGGSSNPVLIMWGIVYITPSAANTPTSKRVNFNHSFQGKPFAFAGALTSVPGVLSCSGNNLSESGFDVVLDRANTVTTSVNWIAIGNGTNALPE